jgi:hypothetical protein
VIYLINLELDNLLFYFVHYIRYLRFYYYHWGAIPLLVDYYGSPEGIICPVISILVLTRGSHLGGRAQLLDTILEKDHPMIIPSKFGSN